MIPYGRQSIDDDDIAAVVERAPGRLAHPGPRRRASSRRRSPPRVGAGHAVAFANGTAALHGACRGRRPRPGRRGRDVAADLRGQRQLRPLRRRRRRASSTSTRRRSTSTRPASRRRRRARRRALRRACRSTWPRSPHRPRVVIEDAAHALGATTPDGPVGNCARSDMCCFSFHPVKPITTGEGGLVTTNSTQLAERSVRFRTPRHRPQAGATAAGTTRSTSSASTTGSPTSRPRSARASSPSSTHSSPVAARSPARYRELLDGQPCLPSPRARRVPATATTSSRSRSPIAACLRGAARRRDRRAGALRARPPPPALAGRRCPPSGFPNTEAVYDGLLSLPIYPGLTDGEQDHVVDDARRRSLLDDRSRPTPNAWWTRARAVIPLGTQTLSKSPTQFVQGASPIYLERGQGAHVWDVDGNEYIDYPMALGPVLLGYAEPVVDEAIRRQLR